MKTKILVFMMGLLLLGFSSVVFADDLDQSYQRKYQAGIAQRNAGANLELTGLPVSGRSVCYDYDNQTDCEDHDCIWDESNSRCYSAICQSDSNFDGKVIGADLNVLKNEYGRMDCPTPPAFNTVPKTGSTISANLGEDGDLHMGVEWPIPRFTIYYCDGIEPCPDPTVDCDADSSDDAVIDNLTGLMWTRSHRSAP